LRDEIIPAMKSIKMSHLTVLLQTFIEVSLGLREQPWPVTESGAPGRAIGLEQAEISIQAASIASVLVTSFSAY
jgi:hypothetical protein